MVEDPYQILGIPHGATEAEIKKAYRKKAKEYHPDLHPNDPVAMKKYQKVLADFQTEHMDLLRLGRFMDVLGFTYEGGHEYGMAKAFETEGKTGVVVWNISRTDPLSWKVDVPGKKLVKVTAPDWDAAEGKPVPPESILLLIYE